MFGDQISLFAVPITAVVLLHAHAAQMGWLTAAGLLPSLLFSLPAGAFADRSGHRRLIMIVSDIARALLMASIPIAYALGGLGMAQLYAVAFVVGVFDVSFNVCAATMFISVVDDKERYVEGQSLLNGSRAASDVFGQSSAGLLIAAVSAAGAIVVDAVTFVVSAFFLGQIEPEEPPAAAAEDGHVSAGLRFIRGSAVMRSALGATTCVNLFTFIFQAIFILYATTELHVRASTLGLVLGAGALGAVLGSLITNRVCRRIGTGWTAWCSTPLPWL
jgi:MFS family permease